MTLLDFMPNIRQQETKSEKEYDTNLTQIQKEYKSRLKKSRSFTQMIEQKNFGLFQYEFYKQALRIHSHMGIVYKLSTSSIDTGDDLGVIREEKGKRRELFTLQFKTGRVTSDDNKKHRAVDIKKSQKGRGGSENHHLRLYKVEEFDFLVCVDGIDGRDDIFIFDRETLISASNPTHYKQQQSLSPQYWDKHHCNRGGWELLMPELKEVTNYE